MLSPCSLLTLVGLIGAVATKADAPARDRAHVFIGMTDEVKPLIAAKSNGLGNGVLLLRGAGFLRSRTGAPHAWLSRLSAPRSGIDGAGCGQPFGLGQGQLRLDKPARLVCCKAIHWVAVDIHCLQRTMLTHFRMATPIKQTTQGEKP